MNDLRVEAEVRQRHMEDELPQEIHMFNQARTLIADMKANFTVEDQGCIRRIEMMLETQRNEYAMRPVEVGNQAEAKLQETSAED